MARLRKAFGVELPLRSLFEAPTPSGLARRIEAALREGHGLSAPPLRRGERALREGGLPLSFAQERLWFLAQLDPGDRSYVIPSLLRLAGPLDRPALARALGALIERHELLRTTFVLAGGAPVQIVHPPSALELPEVDLSPLPAPERAGQMRREAMEEVGRPFDLATGPLLRATLFVLSADEQVLLLTLHHIVADAWSLGIVERELASLYAAFRSGEEARLGELPIQYADYALWQRAWLSGEVLERELAAWREQLAGSSFALELPSDHPRPRVRSSRGGRLHFLLPARLSVALSALARREGVTLFMTLLSAFVTLLHRYTGQRDLVVGTPIANRTRAETEGLIGFFVNTLVLRAKPSPELPYLELLRALRETCLSAYAHQDLPFERLVQELSPERDLGKTPLFQVMFALQNARAAAAPARPGSADEPLAPTSKFDLLLIMGESDEGLQGSFEYARDLFEPKTIERMAQQLGVLLEGIVATPACSLGELPLLPAEEQARLLVEWNQTARPYPRELGLAALFEAQVERSPEAPALRFEGISVGYRHLNEQANRLAHQLIGLGVGLGDSVGICAPRAPSLVVAMLAILKAGAAYVPLDPGYPEERLAFMIADAGLAVILAGEETVSALPSASARVILLGETPEQSAENPEPRAGGGDLAYVIYTSGSTGVPKGVEVLQRGVSRLVLGTDYIALGPSDRVAQASNPSFDAATFEIWGALLNGACLVFVPRELSLSPVRFAALLRDESVTTLFLTTALFNGVVRELPSAFRSLRTVLFGGEAVDPSVVREALRQGPERLLHVYGPTETTTFATWYRVESVPEGAPTVPIGKPIANTHLHVLDAQQRLCPIGVPGELYIGGDGVARGYRGRPELSRERFVPDPFGTSSEERLYRTGDLVRRLADGDIVFLGRLDHQIKLRGFRVELGEIEAVLVAHPAVDEAAVLLREDTPGDKRLVAYVAGQEGALPRAAEMRAHLEKKLPEHMVPAVFVALAALPLTPNGKVDRQALPAPGEGARDESAGEAPRDPVEEALVTLFAEVLDVGVDQLGIRSSFFALGGHSLLATRVMARIRGIFGVDLPLRALFEAPTPAQLALQVEQALRGGQAEARAPLVRVPRDGPLPLSFAQERLWFLDQLTPGDPSYVVPIAQRLTGALDRAALERALSLLLSRHEALRTTFALEEGRPVQVIHEDATLPLVVTEIGALAEAGNEERLRAAVAQEIAQPFDLARGPMLRARLFTLGEDDALLLLTLHHIAADGWSVGVLDRELAAFYTAFAAGETPSPPELPIQAVDHAVWQRRWLVGDTLSPQLAYWRERLAGASFVLELPADRPRPPLRSGRGGKKRFALPAAVAEGLTELSRAEGSTLYMTLLAAFVALLHRHTGQEDLVVGSPIANRALAELEPVVGFLVNTLVLRAEVAKARSFVELLRQVKETCLGAYAHQDLPFERLVEELSPERDTSRTPLFQVMFVLQNAPRESVEIPGLQRRGAFAEGATSKFDLTMTLVAGKAGLSGVIEYSRDLFDPETIERFAARFERLLQGVLERPDAPIDEIPLLPERERETLLVTWNSTAAELPEPHTLHQLIEAQVDRTPDAVALALGDNRISYRELDERANRLAHRLRALGVGPESLVGVSARRTPALVVGLYAVLKAGGAYLPLDPELPRERLSLLMRDAEIVALLCEEAVRERLPEPRAPLLLLEGEPSVASAPAARPESVSRGHHLAYVLYTSGSTGRPKGVMIEHRSVVNYLRWCVTAYRVGEGRGAPVHSSIGFDLTVTSLFAPLVAGRTVTLVPEERGVLGLAEALRKGEDFSLIKLTPSHLEALSAELSGDELSGKARALVIGGEALLSRQLEHFRARSPSTRLINEYGPTETVVGCAVYELPEGPLPEGAIPIGRPIANTRIYLLDARLEPVPVGVTGEIYIAGAQVGRGYLRQPELSRERFLADPFVPGERMYRSGDLGRHRASGELLYLGRRDQQVKVRGTRIELGEIEAVLAGHPSVREAVVLLREDQPGDRRLVAYCTAAAGEVIEARALRRFLAGTLPEVMVPEDIVVLERMPLTENAKIDRRALPAPERGLAREEEEAAFVPPRGPVEEGILAVFEDVLRMRPISASASFFALGGHSLLAVRALTRLRSLFGVELPLRRLFEAPSASSLSPVITEALRADRGPAPAPIPPSRDEAPAPLSFGQERLWVLSQLEPDDPSYLVPLSLRFTGALDRRALEQALQALVRRHALLRTTYAMGEGGPVQIVHPPEDRPLALLDLSALPAEERDEQLRRESLSAGRRAFDLALEAPFRALLLALAEDEHVLSLTMHHIVSDAWSQGLLLRELGALYRAFSTGAPPRLRELPIQYVDYARWQRSPAASASLDAQLAYWKERLAGAPSSLELPADHPRPPVQSHRGGQRVFTIPSELAASLRDLARREGVTPFMLWLALFEVLLFRRSGQGDLLVGSPIANRSRPETEGLIGFFLNTLVLRTQLEDELGFLALLGRVRETCLSAYAHPDLPFERLVQEIAPERDLGKSPLFQVLFTLQSASSGAPSFEGITVRGANVDTGTAKFDLTLSLVEGPEGLTGSFEYSSDLFEIATIERMIAELVTLARGVLARPSAELGELPLLSSEERERIVVAWNATQAELPRELCVHRSIATQAERTPEARAVSCEGSVLTYRALMTRAHRLAHHLVGRGVGPGVRVGVALGRSIDLVIALLAVLEAGGAYVPLDPSYPRERLAFMIADAELGLILSEAALRDELPDARVERLYLDADRALFEGEREDAIAGRVGPEDIAYVIYTSGSTGKPKGVEIPHRALVNFLESMRVVPGLSSADRLLAVTSLSFDIAGLEIFLPLICGAEVEIAGRELAADGHALAERIARSAITVMQATPSTFRLLFEAGWGGAPIRALVGGEALPRDLATLLCQRCASVWNMYGPTETTIWSTVHRVEPSEGAVPIGRPIANTRAYVLDRRGQPVPVGVPGELFLGGEGVARGYLGRPELTAERFVPNPFELKANARMYRTGDLCRFREDGVLEYLGRLDQQVKIRGYRIELGEIEATLGEHPAVREAVVVAREDLPGQKRLVAYVVALGALPESAELRAFLGARLPEYMVPALFVALERMPLLPNGKIDRRALPLPPSSAAAAEAQIAPRDEVERALAAIWQSVLRRPSVSVNESFFEIGGDSILAIQVVTRARSAGLSLTPRQIFQRQTIAALAEVAVPLSDASVELGPIVGPVPLGPMQRAWLEQERVSPQHDNQAVLLALAPELGPAVVERALEALLEHHDMLRLRLRRAGTAWEQLLAPPGGIVPFRAVDASGLDEAEQIASIERIAPEVQASLDLAEGPILRAVLFQMGPSRPGRLLLVIHHLAVDTVSLAILAEDLRGAAERIARGLSPSLPPRTSSFRRWVEQLGALARSEALTSELSYWLAEDRSVVGPLPVDHREGEDRERDAKSVRASLSAEDTEALLRRVPEVYRTQTPDLLLTALVEAFAPWTGRDQLLVQVEGHGREELDPSIDVSRTVGWFTASFPVLLKRDPTRGAGESIQATKERLRAIPRHGLGYGLLRYLRGDREISERLAEQPQAEITFNYLGQVDALVGQRAADRRNGPNLGPTRDPEQRRGHLIEVVAAVLGGQLQVELIFGESRHERSTIEVLARRFVDTLRGLIDHCLTPGAGGVTPSDFTRAKLTQDVIDMLSGMDPEAFARNDD
jgi:amino acid adenylation domain-containing protein/non-ribosomal peptide synthase protein (TIGR01720 family)